MHKVVVESVQPLAGEPFQAPLKLFFKCRNIVVAVGVIIGHPWVLDKGAQTKG
jgi:hypothetical protein